MAAIKHLPVHHHSAYHISFPLGSLGPLWYIWKWSSAHVYARGRKQCCKLHYCLWSLNKTETPFFLIRSVFFVSKAIVLKYISLHCSWCYCRVAVAERLPVHHHSADHIPLPLGSLGLLWFIWKWNSAHVNASGRKQCCKLHYCLWRVSIKPRLTFSNP